MTNTTIRDVQAVGEMLTNPDIAYPASEQLSALGVMIIDNGNDMYVITRIEPQQLKRRGEKIIISLPGLRQGAKELTA